MSDSVAQQQMAHASGLSSGANYRTAPHEVPGVGSEPQGLLVIVLFLKTILVDFHGNYSIIRKFEMWRKYTLLYY